MTAAVLEPISTDHLRGILAELPWRWQARTEQLAPPPPWRTWYIRGGRGSGKTRTGAETIAQMALDFPGDYGVVAPTYADMRDKCIEGPSGILNAYRTTSNQVRRGQSAIVETWNRSIGELHLRNGSTFHGDGADDGATTIQGFNLRGVWADEVGLWKKWQQAWEESIRYAVRLSPARIVATGTPKRGHPLVKSLMGDEQVWKTLMKTSDNASNLDPTLLTELYTKYAGTTLGRQELQGEILDDIPGALWRRDLIIFRKPRQLIKDGQIVGDLARIVVAIDPATTSGEDADETGIVAAGLGADGAAYVLADLTARLGPMDWARRAVQLYHDLKADRIVAEANQGGDMVAAVLRQVDPNIPVTLVHATKGKRTRAEPIAALYEQGKVFHAEPFEHLEDQMCSYTGNPGEVSPDRMDALVWALTDLMVTGAYTGADFSMVA